MQETAWLQAYQPTVTNPPRNKRRPHKGKKSADAG
jgi:hypothetical protein